MEFLNHLFKETSLPWRVPLLNKVIYVFVPVAYPGILFGGGVQQIQLRTEDRQNGDLGVVSP